MKELVVDANVVVKWIVTEEQNAAADALLARYYEDEFAIHVPDLIYAELGSVLWKKVTRGQLFFEEAIDATEQVDQYSFTSHPSRELYRRALDIAHSSNRSAYDCTYLALAERMDATVVTADGRFYRALEKTNWGRYLMLLSDI